MARCEVLEEQGAIRADDRPAAQPAWHRRLLPDRHGGGELESRALRRRALRRARGRRRPDRRVDVRSDAGRGLRRRGQAPDHAGHLRPQRRLLRRVLPEGAAGADADRQRLRGGVREGRRDRAAHQPDGGVPARRAHLGSGADVPRRRLHRGREPGGRAGDHRAVRVHRRAAARRPAVHRAQDGRGHAAAGRGGVSARDRLARAAAAGAARWLQPEADVR